jgi:hypothetical protein
MTARDVRVLQQAMLTAGVQREMEALIARHVEDACKCLAESSLHPAGIAGLIDLTKTLAWRTS